MRPRYNPSLESLIPNRESTLCASCTLDRGIISKHFIRRLKKQRSSSNTMAAYQAIPIDFDEYFSGSPVEAILPSSSGGGEGDRDHRKKLLILGGLLGVLALILVIAIPIAHHKKHHHHGMMTPLETMPVVDNEEPLPSWKDGDGFYFADDEVSETEEDFVYEDDDDSLSDVEYDLSPYDEEGDESIDDVEFEAELMDERDNNLSEDFYNEDDKLIDDTGIDDDAFEEELYDEMYEEQP